MCKYFYDGWDCPYEKLPDSEYCIFHLKDDNKDIEEFNKGINEILETDEAVINFTGFYFPPRTSDFSKKQFTKPVNFNNVVFSRDARFIEAEFSGSVKFDGAKFSGNANFYGAKFSGNANFYGAKFSGDASFGGAEFSGDVWFAEAEFSGNAIFVRAKFSGVVNFSNAILIGKVDFNPNESKAINFENTYFSDNVRIRTNLNQCYFYDSNIERVDMTDSTWDKDINESKLPSKIYNYFLNSSITICEASQGKLASNWKTLEGIYRRLKQSYQKSGDYETAGKFYFQEMECKRKQLGYFHSQFHNIVYRGFCGYGEKPFNVVLISIITMFAFAISYFYNGIEINGTDTINYRFSLNFFDFSWINDFLWSFYTSIITFTTLGYGDVHPTGWSRVFASFESLIGIFMTALFIFVFTRKMLR